MGGERKDVIELNDWKIVNIPKHSKTPEYDGDTHSDNVTNCDVNTEPTTLVALCIMVWKQPSCSHMELACSNSSKIILQ